ncbi:5-formyltetrahydrofolate cyclo-ligase [Synechococcus elongatus]|uniref:5-formyltetrahydrofolate cyclo-ligase n=1 Tax=Synechococcus elongatus PCC 11802 TaxID=2283154 RepID=A0AAT9JVB4_SYNEL|nr:5-formyltetrahydrofolate cyclo-ligase [Synechococcus elongatus]QFZ92634.1 5-formyltetrahydrofolate cyclo-ligase [Synechococcus elongatus PCC 11802]
MTPRLLLDKASLRRQLLAQRRSLTAAERQQYSQAIAGHLQHSPLFQQATTVLSYWPLGAEPDVRSLLSQPKQWALPRCENQQLYAHHYESEQLLEKDCAGVLAPSADSPTVPPDGIDLLIVPAVAVDEEGYRLGYGGGYYDRLRADPAWRLIPAIAVVYAAQVLPELPRDPWDIPFSALCTENGYLLIGST